MAGLLDLFGQRDPNDPVNMGLLGMSAALGTPVRQGGGVGPAFGAFGQGFQNSQQAEVRRRLMEAQMKEMEAEAEARRMPKPRSPMSVTGGYIDVDGKFVRTELPKEPKEPAVTDLAKLIRERDALPPGDPARAFYDSAIRKATTQGPSVSVTNYGGPVPAVGPDGKLQLYQFPNKPNAAPVPTGLQPAPTATQDKPPTEFESKAGLYATSMRNASAVLDTIENKGTSGVGLTEAYAPTENVTNLVRSKDRQAYVQAQRQWIDSINRVRSGANLPEIEYDRAVSTFFPKYGDDKATIAQKKAARVKEEEAMVLAAGRAMNRVPGADKKEDPLGIR